MLREHTTDEQPLERAARAPRSEDRTDERGREGSPIDVSRRRVIQTTAALGVGGGLTGLSGTAAAQTTVDILVCSLTDWFYHQSIPDGNQVIQDMSEDIAAASGADTVTIDLVTDDDGVDAFPATAEELNNYDVLVLNNSQGSFFTADQQSALQGYVQSGGAVVGIHCAADSHHDWPWYLDLIGAEFSDHPAPQTATLSTVDGSHPSTEHLPATWDHYDEFYDWVADPADDVNVLLTIDHDSYDGTTMSGSEHSLAWYHEFDGGRSWYTNLGHEPDTWYIDDFREHVLQGILWAGELYDDSASGPYTEVDTTSAGTATFDQSNLVIEAAGADVWTSDDAYGALIEEDVSGDVVAETTVTSQENTNDWAKAGLLVANDATAAGSSAGDLIVAVTPSNGVVMQWDADGDGFVDTQSGAGTTTYPVSLRVQKSGTTYAGEYSTDGGSTWTTIDTVDVAAANSTQDLGLFVTSHDASTTCTVDFGVFETGASQAVEDGTYRIDAVHSGKPIEAADGTEGATVQQNSWTGADTQKWLVEAQSDGTYRIENVDSGYVADVAGASADDGANVLVWTDGGGDNQRFTLSEDGSGFAIEAVHSGKVIEVANGDTADGTNVQQGTDESGDDQRFSFTPIDDATPIAGSTYTIENVNSGQLMDVEGAATNDGANVIQWPANGGSNQQWTAVDNGDGTVRFENGNSGLVLAPSSGSTSEGASLVQQTWSGTDAQKWTVSQDSNGEYTLENVASGYVADVTGASTSDGADVIQWTDNGGANQRWSLNQI